MRKVIFALIIFMATNAQANTIVKELESHIFDSSLQVGLNKVNVFIHKNYQDRISDDLTDFSIKNIELDEQNYSFLAIIFDDKKGNNITLRGNYDEIISVPVLQNTVQRGDIINNNDILFKEINSKKARRNYIIDIENLVGKQAKRTLVANRILRSNSVSEPILVKRNQTVSVVYRNKFVVLQMMGKALEKGKKGDMIKIKNVASDKILFAEVISPQKVMIANNL